MTDLYERLGRLTPSQRELIGRRLRAGTGDPAEAADSTGPADSTGLADPSGHPDRAAEPVRGLGASVLYFSADAEGAEARPYDLLLETARFADQLGLAAIWLPERHFQRFGGLYPNPSVLAAAAAVRTERIGLRAGSVVLPLHDPIRVAEEWSVVDNLSGGRVGVSFATGWHPGDFALASESFAARREITAAGIETVRALWRGEAVERRDGAGARIEVRIRPVPVQPELPVWLTVSGNPDSWLRAARACAGVLCAPISLGARGIADGVAAYRRAWAECGHRGAGRVTVMLHTCVGEDTEEVRARVREPLTRYLEAFLAQFGSVDQLRSRYPGLEVREDDRTAVVAHAFDRYFDGWSLLGDRAKCAAVLDEVAAAGVDEVACLVDFGTPLDQTLASLDLVAGLCRERGAAA